MHVGQGWLRGFAVVVAGVVSGALVYCQDEPIEIDLLPHSVVDALKSKFPKAELGKALKKEFVGRTVFQIGLTQKGKKFNATIAENGGILEVGKEIPAVELPDAVSRMILEKYPESRFTSVQEITEIKYSLKMISKTGEKVELSVDPAGMVEEENEHD
jgi:hypothetical protein